MRDVVVPTSAAPTFFVPKAVGRRVLIDGGLVANNPTSLARAEAAQIWPGEDVIVVSLGTGTLQRRIPGAAAAGWGKAQWAARVIDCVFDGTSKATETVSRYTLTPD